MYEATFVVGDIDTSCLYFRYQDEDNWYRATISGREGEGIQNFDRWGSYTVGGVGILEMFAADPGGKSLQRYLEIDSASKEMLLSLGSAATPVKISGAAGGAEITQNGDRKILKIAPHAATLRLQLVLGADANGDLRAFGGG